MRILIVTATSLEVDPITAALLPAAHGGVDVPSQGSPKVRTYTHQQKTIDVLTGVVGMVATSAWCARELARTHYDLALNLGVCGSFDRRLQPGAVVHVVHDRIAELGAEDGEDFLAIEQLGLEADGDCSNMAPPANAVLASLPTVSGISVNTVHGNEQSIAAVVARFRPQVESMEGAAFMYACAMSGVPFAQVRAVSNFVERRNRDSWKLREAIDNLGRTALQILSAV